MEPRGLSATGRAYDPLAGPTSLIPPTGRPPAPNRWPFVVGAFAILIIAIAVIAVLVLSSGSSDDNKQASSQTDLVAAYQQRVVTAFQPVDNANRHVSAALNRLNSGRAASAQQAVNTAQDATNTAKGALGAIAVPTGGEQFASQVRQVLDRESSYLQAVQSALSHPSSGTASPLQPLASNLTSDLGQIGGPLANAAATSVARTR